MPLKTLDTKLDLQGFLSGASDVTAGTYKKFALGGFTNGTNGIANSAIVAPITYIPSSKNSILFSHEIDQTNASNVTIENESEETLVSNKYAINPYTPEPLGVFSFSQTDTESLLMAAYQAYFEDKCSLEFSKQIIKLAKQANEKQMQDILSSVEEEVKKADENLRLIQGYLNSCLDVNNSFNSIQQNLVKVQVASKYEMLSPDKLGLDGRGGNDAFSLLNFVGASMDTLLLKSNTALMTQLLYLASKQMTNGSSNLLLGDNTVYPNRLRSAQAKNESTFIDTKYANDNSLNLKSISMETNPQQSFIYPDIENVPYMSKLKLELVKGKTHTQRAAYLLSMLANEMVTSTGIGRLEGTSIGNAFGLPSGYRKNFWGADEQLTDATSETTSPDCLTDYFVVSENGNNRLSSEKGVLLFEGSRQSGIKNRSNAFDAFISNSIRNPLSKEKNKSIKFSNAIQSASSRFDVGMNFYKVLQCRDKNVKLMTPRGLFSRLAKDFADSLSFFQTQDSAVGNHVIEMCLLSILGKESISSIGSNTPSSIIKRSLLAVMAKKAMQMQYSFESANSKTTVKEAQKSNSVSPVTKVTTTTPDKKTSVVEVQSEVVNSAQSSAENSSQNSFSFNPNTRNPRLCLDEKLLFERKQKSDITSEICLSGFGKLPMAAYNLSATITKELSISVGDFYNALHVNQDGFLDKLVKIYIDMCEESIKFCNDGDVTSSPVGPTRLTKNSKIDGSLLLAMILEAACSLCAEYINGGISKRTTPPGLYQSKDIAVLSQLNSYFKFEVGENSKTILASRALSAISKASDGDDFNSVFLPENGNLILPEIGSLPQNVQISYDGNGNTTVASIVDMFYDLVFERELPALCLATVAGTIDYFDKTSSKYRDVSAQMLGAKTQTDETKTLVSFAQTTEGSKFFSSLNDFSLTAANRKLDILKKELVSPSGRIPKITLGELRCIQRLLLEFSKSPNTNNFVVVALPHDFVNKSLNEKYTLSLDMKSPHDELMSISLQKIPLFSKQSSSSEIKLMVRSPLTSDSFSEFDKRDPTSLLDLISNVLVDGSKLGSDFVNQKIDQNLATNVLISEVTSYLMKKLFSTLSSADLFADNISDFDVFPVSSQSATIAKFFSKAYGLSLSAFDNVFAKLQNGTSYISEDKLLSLSKSDFDISESSVSVATPPLKFGESELFYDLFETVYFQQGVISKRIFAVPLLDETAGFIMNASNFSKSDTQLVTTNGSVNSSGIQQSLQGQVGSKQIPAFDTYSVSVMSTNPLVNK